MSKECERLLCMRDREHERVRENARERARRIIVDHTNCMFGCTVGMRAVRVDVGLLD